MTIKPQINHGVIKKCVTCVTTFFIPFTYITLCEFYFYTSPVLLTENKKLWNERKEDFL